MHAEDEPDARVLPADVRLSLAQLDVCVPQLQNPRTVNAAKHTRRLAQHFCSQAAWKWVTVKRIKLVFFSLWVKSSSKYLFCLGSRHWHFSSYRGRIETHSERGMLLDPSPKWPGAACPSQGPGVAFALETAKATLPTLEPQVLFVSCTKQDSAHGRAHPAQKGTPAQEVHMGQAIS